MIFAVEVKGPAGHSRGKARAIEHTLILHGKQDTTVPYASVVAFESVMKQAGRPCKLVGFDGAQHGFLHRGEYYSKTLADADAFLVDLGWIKK